MEGSQIGTSPVSMFYPATGSAHPADAPQNLGYRMPSFTEAPHALELRIPTWNFFYYYSQAVQSAYPVEFY